ncbi:MAG: GTPase Era, partial [Firmicutes bacterium]|nr:GTPase Era [Bacillota bacterium]
RSVENALSQVDVCLFLVEPYEKISERDRFALNKLKKVDTPVFLVINKIDTVEKSKLLAVIDEYSKLYDFAEVIPVSALKGQNTDELIKNILKYLPEGPMYFPEDMVTDQPERQIVSEIVREKALLLLKEEIPHGIAVEVNSMKKREGRDLVDVEVTIYCEKDTHKGIIIGKRGEMLKKIGMRARQDAENLLGSPIYLKIWVKVKKDWRDSDFLLKNFGYDKKNI